MDISLGLTVPDDQQDSTQTTDDGDNDVPEVMIFPENCSHCNAPSETKMHVLNIPHFKEVIIMATNCDVSKFLCISLINPMLTKYIFFLIHL